MVGFYLNNVDLIARQLKLIIAEMAKIDFEYNFPTLIHNIADNLKIVINFSNIINNLQNNTTYINNIQD
jgi:hypothetical protein